MAGGLNVTGVIYLDPMQNPDEEEAKMGDSELLHQDIIAASLIFVIGMCGLIANFFSLRLIYKLPALHNCFGYLCFIHALGEAGVLAVFVFWSTSMSLIETAVAHSYLGMKFGQIILISYFITLYSQLLKALNRLVAISSPMNYRRIFNETNAKYFVTVVICLALCHGVVYFFDGCDFYFNAYTLVWTFESSPCGKVIAFYIDFIYGCSFMVVVILIDVCTLLNINRSKKALGIDQNGPPERKKQKEIRFFIQTCLTSILYTLMLASFHLVSTLNANKWHVFLSTSIAWELCHTLDALILIIFNAKHHKSASSKNSKNIAASVSISTKATTKTAKSLPRVK